MMKFGPPNLCFIDTNNSEQRIQIMKIPSIQHSSVVYYIEDDCLLGSYAVYVVSYKLSSVSEILAASAIRATRLLCAVSQKKAFFLLAAMRN
jgi:hypothetical protein